MPYTADSPNLPANIRGLSKQQRRKWSDIWNTTYTACQNGADPSSGDCESKAYSVANGVLKAQHSMPLGVVDAEEFLSSEDIIFKTLSHESRKNLPKTAYAYTDSSGKGHLPIHDLVHLRNAISRLGNSKTGKKWGLSDEARKRLQDKLQTKLEHADHTYDESIAHDVVAFDLGRDENGDIEGELIQNEPDSNVVIRRGKIFASGEYPDKDFSLTPKELRKVAKNFGDPINLDSEHERSIFDGKLGKLMSVEASEDGTELHGLVAIPKWLDPILMAAGGKVSAAFDRVSKKLVGLALTISPRVSDAALMAAFSLELATQGVISPEKLIKMAAKGDKKMAKKQAKLDQKSQKLKDQTDNEDDDDQEVDNADDDATMATTPQVESGNPQEKSQEKPQSVKRKFVGYDSMIPAGGRAGQNAHAEQLPPTKRGAVKMATTYRGMMQTIHDVTASRGAVCRVEPQPATDIGQYGIVRYATKNEMDTIQAIHDSTLQSGASCTPTLYGQQDVPGGAPWTWMWPGVTSDGRSGIPGETKAPHFSEKEENSVTDNTVTDNTSETGSDKTLKAFAKFMSSFEGIDPRYGKDSAVRTESRQTTDGDVDSRRLDEENAKLREENRQMRMQGILDRAVAFADKMVHEGHAVPIEREAIVTVHAQAEHDDTWTAKATFSNGMSRVAVYEASILARPNNLLAAELLPAAVREGLIKFANMSETPRPTDAGGNITEERKRLLASLDPVLKKHSESVYTSSNGKK